MKTLSVALIALSALPAFAGNNLFPVYPPALPYPHEITFEGRTFVGRTLIERPIYKAAPAETPAQSIAGVAGIPNKPVSSVDDYQRARVMVPLAVTPATAQTAVDQTDAITPTAVSVDAAPTLLSDATKSDDTRIKPSPRVSIDDYENARIMSLLVATESQTKADLLVAMADESPSLDLRETATGEVAMVMLSEVLFDYGRADLSPAATEALSIIAKNLDDMDGLEITGHTDSVGRASYNLQLGQQRADTVRDWLISTGGMNPDAVTARGVGEADPIANNEFTAGRAANRRVEFTFKSLDDTSPQKVVLADAVAATQQQ